MMVIVQLEDFDLKRVDQDRFMLVIKSNSDQSGWETFVSGNREKFEGLAREILATLSEEDMWDLNSTDFDTPATNTPS